MTAGGGGLERLGTLERAKRYQRIRHLFYFSGLALTGSLLCLLALTPLGTVLRQAAGGFSNPWIQLQVYFLLFSLVFFCFDLPLEFASGYWVEKRFELSHYTPLTWAWDEAKKAVLSFVIFSFLIQLFYWLIRTSPENWWWIGWILYFLFNLLFTKIVPLWIIPLFYKYGPIENQVLIARIRGLAGRYGLAVGNFFSLNLSRTTRKANAMFTGLGKTKRVVLGDTLLKNFTDDEITTILAHEIGHFKKRHILKQIVLGGSFSLVLFYLSFVFLNARSAGAGPPAHDPVFFPQWALLVWIAAVLTDPLFKALSRYFEREADTFALEAVRMPASFISAFRKLAEQNLADPEPNPWIERLLYTHPSIAKRIRFAEKFSS
jgi:STE24 endopeptidase